MTMRKKHSRRSRHRLYVVAVALLVMAAIIFLNLSASLMETKFGWFADFSRSSIFTLSEDTRKLLAELTEDVLLYAVYENDAQDVTVEQLLMAYDRASEHISSEVVDPVDDVDLLLDFTKEGAAVNSGSIIVSDAQRENFEILDYYDFYLVGTNGITGIQGEQSISSAIHHLSNPASRRVIFMNAHTETTIASAPAFATHLTASGYALFQSDDVFSAEFASMLDAENDLLVFLSPSSDLEEEEADALIEYIRRGGRVMAFMDYSRSVDNSLGISLVYETWTNFDRVFVEAGMRLNQDLVLIPEDSATLGSVTRFNASVVNNAWMNGADTFSNVVMSECATIEIVDDGAAQALLICPDVAYVKEIQRDMELVQSENDIVGERCVGACGAIGKGKLALVGTSSIATSYFGNEANREVGLRIVSGLLADGGNPIIMPVSTGSGSLQIHTRTQQIILIVLLAGIFPMSVLIFGGIVLFRRRRRSGRMQRD